MKNKRLYDIISTILALNKRKKRDLYNILDGIESSKADWNEQDENSLNYIDNKPFGDKKNSSGTGLVPQQNVNGQAYVGVRLDFNKMIWTNTYDLKIYYDKNQFTNILYEHRIVPAKFIIDYDGTTVDYEGHTFYPVKIFNERYNFYTNATIRAFNKNYNIYMEGYDINFPIWDSSFLCVSGNIKRLGFDFYSSYENDGTPSAGAERINIACQSTRGVLDIEYRSNIQDLGKLYIIAYSDTYEVVQVPDKYVNSLIERIETLEQRVQELEGE